MFAVYNKHYNQIMWILILLFVIIGVNADYWSARKQFIKNEESLAMGSRIVLNEKEQIFNKYLMDAKRSELDFGFKNPGSFPPARHFFKAKQDIEKSTVFNIIRKMPKGGALHIHDTALCSVDYIVYNITYRNNLFGCESDEGFKMKFADSSPTDKCWKPMKMLRQQATNETEFNAWLKTKLTLITDKPEEKYTDINVVWESFGRIFGVITPMLTYQPVFKDYFYNALEEFYNDNINFVEVRGTLPEVYDLNGLLYTPIQVLGMLKDVADAFMEKHPDFLGIKYIYAPMRHVDNKTLDEYLQVFQTMQTLHPDFLVGFDLVGQEDLGIPLSSFVNQLEQVENNVKFYFHAGETDWNGMSTDMNLIDAILLNTTRIGHGYALTKHPAVMKEVKRRGIGIEVNPISNQVLLLVKDLRNHPASYLFALDYPVVISSDDPGLWGAAGLSHDFYEAFMGIASKSSDLRMLKQLILNSFEYSSFSDNEKLTAVANWNLKWNKFIDSLDIDHDTTYSVFNV